MTEIREEFINQAKHLARNAEVLPGGIEELAAKLQHAADTKNSTSSKTWNGSNTTGPSSWTYSCYEKVKRISSSRT